MSEELLELEQEREYLSYSSINTMRMCGMLYYWKYVAGMKEQMNDALLLGSVVHYAIGEAMKEKIETGSYDIEKFLSVCEQKFEEMLKNDIEWKKGKTASSVLDDALRCVDEYLHWANDNVVPLFAEKKLNFKIGGRDMVCYIDLVDAKGTIIDIKTKKRSPNQTEAQQSDQLAIYAEAMRQNNLDVKNTRLDCIVIRKDFIDIVNVESKHPLNRDKYLKTIVNNFNALERNKIFMPTLSGNWKCSKTYCSFWALCRKKGVV